VGAGAWPLTFYKEMKILIFVAATFLLYCSTSFGDELTVEAKAANLFKDFEGRKFTPVTSFEGSGWMMETSNGAPLQRSFLQGQAKQIVALGIESFPVVFQKLDHKEMYIRYIAVQSLISITGLDPIWYYFGTPGEQFNGDLDWSDRAKEEWKTWYTKNNKK
jgi:hypothetical protein